MGNKIKNISYEMWILIIGGICFLILIISLFTMQYRYLESGKRECESRNGEWSSWRAGNITMTDCKKNK